MSEIRDLALLFADDWGMTEARKQELAEAVNNELKNVTDDEAVLGSPRFAFMWGFLRGVKYQEDSIKRRGIH